MEEWKTSFTTTRQGIEVEEDGYDSYKTIFNLMLINLIITNAHGIIRKSLSFVSQKSV